MNTGDWEGLDVIQVLVLLTAAELTEAVVGPKAAGDPFGIRHGGVSEVVTTVWETSASSVASVCQLCLPFFFAFGSRG